MLRKTMTILSLIGLLLSVAAWELNTRYSFGGSVSMDQVWLSLGAGAVFKSTISMSYIQIPEGRKVPNLSTQWIWKKIPVPQTRQAKRWISIQRTGAGKIVIIPVWMPILLFGSIITYCCLPFHRRRKRKKLGLCVNCGYDLRASKERCPECGTAVETT